MYGNTGTFPSDGNIENYNYSGGAELSEQKLDSSYFDERAAEIAKTFSYDGYRIVRREMFAHTRVPAVTIRYDSITFNTACISGLEDAVYIQLMVSQNQKRIAIRKRDENDKDALRWCVANTDKRKSRKIVGHEFSRMIYGMMGWDRKCRYKITGHKIFFNGEYLYVFELSEPEIFHERPKRSKQEKEELAQTMSADELERLKKKEAADSRKPFYPDDVENTFGLPVNEHKDKLSFGDPSSFHGMKEFISEEENTEDVGTSAGSEPDQNDAVTAASGYSQQSMAEDQKDDPVASATADNFGNVGGGYGYNS